MPHYQGDMMHCDNKRCLSKDKCYRFWLLQNAKGLCSCYHPNKDMKKCKYFLDIKDY